MENKTKNEKTARILYLVVVGVLVIGALVIGLVAAFGKEETKLPDTTPPVEETPTPTPPPATDTDTSQPSGDEGGEEPISTYLAPASGTVSKAHDESLPVYSITMDDFRVHSGIDIATAAGADVLAVARGTVTSVWSDPLMGECVSVDHGNGVVSVYKNLAKEMAQGITKGASVTAGQKLGVVGDTALIESAEEPHLHFEMTFEGKQVDPLTYITESSKQVSFGEDVVYES